MHRERLLRDFGHATQLLVDQLKLLALGVAKSGTLLKDVEELNHGIEWIAELMRDGRRNASGCGHFLAGLQRGFGALALGKITKHHHSAEGDSVAEHRRGSVLRDELFS